MSPAYLEFLAEREKDDEWSFFDLTGCPGELVVRLYELADLARQQEIAASMRWLRFDMTAVHEAERRIAAWKNDCAPDEDEEVGLIAGAEEEADAEAESRFHDAQDRYHCAEAWRHALLLYIARVFNCTTDRPRSIPRLARLTLDHVRCVRRSSQIQKQQLLPVFLGGSESADGEMRAFAKEYCRYWAETCRYEMFGSVPVLLEEIWAEKKWWGTVIDGKTRQFLFG